MDPNYSQSAANSASSLGSSGAKSASSLGWFAAHSASALGSSGADSASSLGSSGAESASSLGWFGAHSASALGSSGADSASSLGSSGAKSASSLGWFGAKTASALGSSGTDSASSLGSSAISKASDGAKRVTASLSSTGARASASVDANYQKIQTPSTLWLSPIPLSILAILIGGAYYYGYLDGLISYLQSLFSQANDKKEQLMKDNTGHAHVRDAVNDLSSQAEQRKAQLMKDNTGHTHVRDAVKEQYDGVASQARKTTDQATEAGKNQYQQFATQNNTLKD